MTQQTFLTADDAALLLIDYQPQMVMGVRSDDPASVLANAQIIAKGAKLFGMPTVLITIAADTFAGRFMPEIAHDVFPDVPVIDRSSINAWHSTFGNIQTPYGKWALEGAAAAS